MSKHKHHHHHRSHREKVKLTKAENVDKFLLSISRKHKMLREKINAYVEHYLRKHHISGTNNEDYWRKKGIMVMIGMEQAIINLEFGKTHDKEKAHEKGKKERHHKNKSKGHS